MPLDARELWWPPFHRLYNQLSSCKLTASPESVHSLQTSLAEYEKWLGVGIAYFKEPDENSKRAFNNEVSLTIGEKKLPIDPALRKAALDVSCFLQLNEVQSYILLRRWVLAGNALPASGLTAHQLGELAGEYARERICLLKATEELLWLGEEVTSDAFSDVVEGTLSQLLDGGLEEAAFQALQVNLEGKVASKGALVAAAQTGYTSLFGVGGSGGWGAAGGRAGGGISQEQRGFERCALLNILTLIYYHPRKQCTSDRFLSLARLFHTHLFTAPLPRQQHGSSSKGAAPERLGLKLAAVLLLEMLDVDKALTAVAEGSPLTEDNYAFAAVTTRRQVHAELSSWWDTAGTAHSPVLLAWSAVLCLVAKSSVEDGGGQVSADEYGSHAQRAHELGALGMLCQLTSMEGMAPNAAEMRSNILLSVVSSVVCAFDLSPISMPLPLTDQMVTILCNLYKDQPALCDSFWLEERGTEDPLRHFLEDIRGLFPAFPTFLYRLLCALCATSDSAVAANAFLAGLDALVCLHSSQEEGIMLDANDDGNVYTEDVVPLPGSKALTLPQGILGEVFPLPEGAATFPASALMLTWQGAEAPEGLALVRWGLPLAAGTGQWILLCRAFESLAALQQVYASADVPPPTPVVKGALCELSAALRLLCAICSHDAQTALELLHVEVPAGEASLVEGAGGPDILTLACHAVTVLCQLADPPTEAIGNCFMIMDSLVQSVPGRVHSELLGVLQLGGGLLTEAVQAQDIPLLSRVLSVECGQGAYPATRAFLRLATSLISSAAPGQELKVFVRFVLRRLLPEHHRWRYAARTDRWRLASAALRMLRYALLAADVQQVAEEALRYDVGVAATLLPALPPPARALEALSLESHAEVEVVAVEECCREWLRLLPVLLPEQGGLGAPEGASFLGAGAFFHEDMDPAGAPCAAATFLSYLTYAFFGGGDRALVLTAANSLATAAAAAATSGMAFSRLFPSGTGVSDLSPEVKAVFVAALDVEQAVAHPHLACCACSLLTSAVLTHASLADALMFPSEMEQGLRQLPPKENQDGNAGSVQPGALVATKKGGQQGSPPSGAAGSCLDAVWSLLQHSERLKRERPEVLAALLRLLSMLWQSGPSTYRPVGLLRQQPLLWSLLTSLLPSPDNSLPSSWVTPAGTAGGAAGEAQQGAAWEVAAEAHVLQILAAEAFMAAASLSPKEALPGELREALRQQGGTFPALLERYCTPLPTPSVLRNLHSAAAAVGLEILGAALADGVVWPSLGATPSLVSRLHTAAVPLLSQFGSREAAVRAITEHAASIVERNREQRAVQDVAEVVLDLAEVPSRAAAGREFGAGYVLDARQCVARLGSVLAQQAPAVQSLSSWLGAASWAASLEDSRLGAATALRALLAGLHKYAARLEGSSGVVPAPTLGQLQKCLGSLEAAVTDLIEGSQGGYATSDAAPAASGTLDLHSVHAASTAESALTLLLLLRQWAAEQQAEPAAAAGLCCTLLRLVSQWISALGDLESSATTGSTDGNTPLVSYIQTSTSSLLTAALLTVEALPEFEDVPFAVGRGSTQELQEAAVRCLPALLQSCQLHRTQHLAELTALASSLMQRLVPEPARLPIVRSSLQLGALLGWLLKGLITQGLLGSQHAQQHASQQHVRSGAAGQLAVLGLGQGVQQAAQRAQQEEAAAASGQRKAELAALSLALQVAQVAGGAQLLCEQGMVGHVLLLSKWLLPSEGGNLMGVTPRPPAGRPQPVDYSNAYHQDGSPNPAHQLWCSCLSLMGLLLSALPGYEVVEAAALELAVAGEGRLLLAVEPAAGSREQPLTLGMLQEARFTLFFLTGLARLAGRWRVLLPDSLPQLRQASASLLEFAAQSHNHKVHCVAASAEERALAKQGSQQSGITEGWVRAFEHGEGAVGGTLAVHMAEKLYSCAQFALCFQLAAAPEVYEEEAGLLGPEWPSVSVLSELQDQCLAMASAAPRRLTSDMRRLYRIIGQVLGGTVQLQQAMAVPPAHQQMARVTRVLEQLEEAVQLE